MPHNPAFFLVPSQTGKISGERERMILQDVIDDIHALYEDLKVIMKNSFILSVRFFRL